MKKEGLKVHQEEDVLAVIKQPKWYLWGGIGGDGVFCRNIIFFIGTRSFVH